MDKEGWSYDVHAWVALQEVYSVEAGLATGVVLVIGRHDFLREIGLCQFFRLGRALEHSIRRKRGAQELAYRLGRPRDLLEDELGGDEPEAARLVQPLQSAGVGHELGVIVTADHRRIEVERKDVHGRIHVPGSPSTSDTSHD